MTNQVKVQFSSDSKDTQRALDKMNSNLVKTEQRLDRLKNKSKQSTSAGKRGFDAQSSSIGRMVTRLGSAAAAYLTVGSAIRLVGSEFERAKREQQAFLDATVEPAEALAKVKLNFVPDETLSRANFEEAVFKLAEQVNQPVANVATSLGGVLSAKGDLTAQQAFELSRQTGRLRVFDPAFNQELATSAADIGKKERIEDPRILIGSLINAQAAVEGSKLQDLGKNLLPGVIAMRNFGFSFEQAMELGTGIAQLGVDRTGTITGTALPNFGQKLLDFVPQRAKKGKFKGQFVAEDPRGKFVIPEEQVQEFQKAMAESPNDIWEIFPRSPELLRAFKKELSGSLRAKVRQPFISLLEGQEEAVRVFKKSQDIIKPLDQDQAQRFEEQVKFQESGRLEEIAHGKRRAAVEKEQALLAGKINQRIALAREKFEDTLKLVDLVGVDAPQETFVRFGLEKAFKRIQEEGGSPEFEVAKALKAFPREAKSLSLFSDDMTPEDVGRLKDAIEKLESQAETKEPIPSARERTPDAVKRAVRSVEMDNILGAAGVVASGSPELAEMLKELRAITENTAELRRANPPRQTERPSSRRSRGN